MKSRTIDKKSAKKAITKKISRIHIYKKGDCSNICIIVTAISPSYQIMLKCFFIDKVTEQGDAMA